MTRIHILPVLFVYLTFGISLTQSLEAAGIWPTDASRVLTSTFAEFRPGHFHSGLDIKTWSTGQKVFSVANGSVIRLKVSPYGYGKVLYVQHDNGYYSVYAHLSRFNTAIDALVEEEQWNRMRYEIELFFKPGQIPVKQGEIIAYTGRTGIGLPHLHFEIRDPHNRPVNPIDYQFLPEDTSPPIATRLVFTPFSYNGQINNDWKSVIYRCRKITGGQYRVREIPRITGPVGIALDHYDQNGQTANKFGLYSLRLLIDNQEWFSSDYKRFGFHQTRQIELDRHYRLLREGKGIFQKLYRDRSNSLEFYASSEPGYGVLQTGPQGLREGLHDYRIELHDVRGNISTVHGQFRVTSDISEIDRLTQFNVQEHSSPPVHPDHHTAGSDGSYPLTAHYYDQYIRFETHLPSHNSSVPYLHIFENEQEAYRIPMRQLKQSVFYYAYPMLNTLRTRLSVFCQTETSQGVKISDRFDETFYPIDTEGGQFQSSDKRLSVSYQSHGTYFPTWCYISEDKTSIKPDSEHEMLSPVYRVEPALTPINKGAEVKIRYAANIPNPETIGIYYYRRGRWVYLNSKHLLRENAIVTSVKSLERFVLIRDAVSPIISRISPRDKAVYTNRRPLIQCYVYDGLSGIHRHDEVQIIVDDTQLIAVYDPETRKVTARPRHSLRPGEHTLSITVKDKMNNTTRHNSIFIIR